jgi:hypothetical protein
VLRATHSHVSNVETVLRACQVTCNIPLRKIRTSVPAFGPEISIGYAII